jgi:hypothetical protein
MGRGIYKIRKRGMQRALFINKQATERNLTNEHTSAGFESVGAKGKDITREAGLKEGGLVSRYGGSSGRIRHCQRNQNLR